MAAEAAGFGCQDETLNSQGSMLNARNVLMRSSGGGLRGKSTSNRPEQTLRGLGPNSPGNVQWRSGSTAAPWGHSMECGNCGLTSNTCEEVRNAELAEPGSSWHV